MSSAFGHSAFQGTDAARATNPLAHPAVDHIEALVSLTDIGVIEAATGSQQRKRPDCNTGMAAEPDHG